MLAPERAEPPVCRVGRFWAHATRLLAYSPHRRSYSGQRPPIAWGPSAAAYDAHNPTPVTDMQDTKTCQPKYPDAQAAHRDTHAFLPPRSLPSNARQAPPAPSFPPHLVRHMVPLPLLPRRRVDGRHVLLRGGLHLVQLAAGAVLGNLGRRNARRGVGWVQPAAGAVLEGLGTRQGTLGVDTVKKQRKGDRESGTRWRGGGEEGFWWVRLAALQTRPSPLPAAPPPPWPAPPAAAAASAPAAAARPQRAPRGRGPGGRDGGRGRGRRVGGGATQDGRAREGAGGGGGHRRTERASRKKLQAVQSTQCWDGVLALVCFGLCTSRQS